MTALKPYLLRSIYEWVIDNSLTPHLLVDATHPEVIVPVNHINEGQIILNIRPTAIQGLEMENASIEFNARFNGQSTQIFVPMDSVLAIYAQENGRGMVFDSINDENSNITPEQNPPPKKPHLHIVK
jgi:stringent starvation protein B